MQLHSKKIHLALLVLAPFGLWAACGGGGNGDPTAVNGNRASQATLAGQFLASCPSSTAIIQSFTGALPITLGQAPTVGSVLVNGNPNDIPVIGGLVPSLGNPSQLTAISASKAEGMLPGAGIPTSLPVIGTAPVTCGTVPVSTLPDPTHAPGLVPVFNQAGDLRGVVLATVGNPPSGAPNVSGLGLPPGTTTLPDPFASVVAQILAVLPLPTPTPTSPPATRTPGPSPTPTATPTSIIPVPPL